MVPLVLSSRPSGLSRSVKCCRTTSTRNAASMMQSITLKNLVLISKLICGRGRQSPDPRAPSARRRASALRNGVKTAMYRIRTDTTCHQARMYVFEGVATHRSSWAIELPLLVRFFLLPAFNPLICE